MANRGYGRGRTIPNNLNEQLAIQDAMARPLAGKALKNVPMTDVRWLGLEGWVKMQQVYNFADGTSTTIHYVLNQLLMLMDDFKFVFP